MNDKVNMLLQSVEFKDWASFVNTTGVGQLLAGIVLEERNKVSMFTNIPGLVSQTFNIEKGAGDQVEVYKGTAARGVGLPGESQNNRQLSGNEAQFDFNFAKESLTVGVHRYAVALRNFTDEHFLPTQMVQYALASINSWWVDTSDNDVFFTLFRDYPAYYAEKATIHSSQEERLLALFGRGVRNDVFSDVVTYMPNGKTDIENATEEVGLRDEDTLSDTFLRKLNSFCQNVIGMAPLAMEDSLANYGLIVDQSDINFLRANSSGSLEDKIKTAFQGQGWDSPVFKNVIMDLEGIRLFKWDPLAVNDHKNAIASFNSSYKGLRGTAMAPMGRVLAAVEGGKDVSGLSVWKGGDIAGERGIKEDTGFFLLVSNGASHFPYFENSKVTGAQSLNKFEVDSGLNALDSKLTVGNYVGRLQIGDGNSALTRFKIFYTGPIYVGSLKVGTPFQNGHTFVEDVYKLKVHAISTWNAENEKYNAPVALSAEHTSATGTYADILKAFLGIDPATNVISQAQAFNNFKYQKNQRIHMFDVVRSLAFGRDIIYEAYAGKGLNLATEKRDYDAVFGHGLTAVAGKKVVTDTQGLIRGYVVVAFKRPQNLL